MLPRRRKIVTICLCFALCALHSLLAQYWALAAIFLVMVPVSGMDPRPQMHNRTARSCAMGMVLLHALLLSLLTPFWYLLIPAALEVALLELLHRKKT